MSTTSYTLETINTIREDGETMRCRYSRHLHVRLLKQEKGWMRTNVRGMYMEDAATSYAVYCIETDKATVKLHKHLQKANDFTQRMLYRYDGIEVRVSQKGQLLQVENVSAMQQQWQQLKTFVEKDYAGAAVEEYVTQTAQTFIDNNALASAFNQYFFFGLLFTGIPGKHGPQWQQERQITLSEYEEETFREVITARPTADGNRSYSINGGAMENSTVIVEKYEGQITIPPNELLPINAEVQISFQNAGIRNAWHFKLQQQTQAK